MSDQLKKYIQQYKPLLDHEDPNPDLYNKILNKLDEKQFFNELPKTSIKHNFYWYAIAASILLFITIAIVYNPTIKNSNQVGLSPNVNPQQNIQDITTKNINPILESKPNHKEYYISETDSKSTKRSSAYFDKTLNVLAPSKSIEKDITTIQIDDSNTKPFNIGDPIAVNNLEKSSVITEINDLSKAEITTPLTDITKPIESISDLVNIENNKTKEEIVANLPIPNSDVESDPSLKSVIKKGFFNFLSKKAKKWTGDALTIENVTKNNHNILAIQLKTEKIDISKSFQLNDTGF